MTLEQAVLENFRELPKDKQQEVLDFIQFLKYKLSPEKTLYISDNQENFTVNQENNDFWSALQDFRQRVDLKSIDDDTFENLRDKSPGREVNL
jgi:nicotinic acid phosphoribosyltransferase